jgi:predicted ester cyclase
MRFTIVDSIAESNKIASTFVVEGTHKQEFRGIPATHKKFETVGITVFHFDGNKIKEAWVVVDGLSAALQIGVVRRV